MALARVLARDPGVLLLDEPLSALDARTRAGAARELAGVLRDLEVPSLLVTHDFAEAAQLGDRVGVIDAGRVIQEGTPTELAAAPRSAFVADFTGAVVLTGVAGPGADGLTRVELDGGGAVTSTDPGEGRVAVSIYPWEIAIEPVGEPPHGSAQNRLTAEVLSVTTVGNRVRLGLAGPQPLAAEITRASAERLGLRGGCQRRGQLEGGGHAARVGLVVPVPAAVERLEQVVDRRVARGERGQPEAPLDRGQDRGGVVLGVVDAEALAQPRRDHECRDAGARAPHVVWAAGRALAGW